MRVTKFQVLQAIKSFKPSEEQMQELQEAMTGGSTGMFDFSAMAKKAEEVTEMNMEFLAEHIAEELNEGN